MEPSEAHPTYRQITEDLLRPLAGTSAAYWGGILVTVGLMAAGLVAFAWQIRWGMGVTGLQWPMMWAVYITNFVWWIGIAHSGTLISAILYLLRAPYRAAFSRASEAMTLIAITTAGMFPIIHLGRTWRFYWLLPYPNERQLWINFRSPLILDVFAVSTYFVISALFFWFGLVPDVAIIRDRASGWRRTLYGLLSIGWEGSSRQWKHYLLAYGILAGLATPLVVSVHSVVSWDFASAIVPGWHSTIFPPYFVAGAIFSGLAMVLTLVIPMRRYLRLERYITVERLDALSVLVLLTSLIVSYSYITEYFMLWFQADPAEIANYHNKFFGDWKFYFWIMTVCNMLVPLSLFWKKARRNLTWLWILSLLVNVGMWVERFVIIPGSLGRDHVPYTWAHYSYRASWVEICITLGTVGWFLFWFMVFSKVAPVLPIAEVKGDLLKEQREEKAVAAAEAAGG